MLSIETKVKVFVNGLFDGKDWRGVRIEFNVYQVLGAEQLVPDGP